MTTLESNITSKTVPPLDVKFFNPTDIPFDNCIEANDYKHSGLINTIQLSSLPNDYRLPFVNAPTHIQHAINSFLIIYNPVSGYGKGKTVVNEYLIPKLQSYNIKYCMLESKAPNFITDVLINNRSELEDMKFEAFIVVGGDGTYHEFVNGYLTGEWKLPVLLIMGGTGNALNQHLGFVSSSQMEAHVERFLEDNQRLAKCMLKCTDYKTDDEILLPSPKIANENKNEEEENNNILLHDGIRIQYLDCIQISSLEQTYHKISDEQIKHQSMSMPDFIDGYILTSDEMIDICDETNIDCEIEEQVINDENNNVARNQTENEKSIENEIKSKNDDENGDKIIQNHRISKHLMYAASQTYWGIPGDGGSTAESLKIFGQYRYDIAAFYQILRKSCHKTHIILEYDDDDSEELKIFSFDMDISALLIMKNKFIGKNIMISPLSKSDNGLLDVGILPNKSRSEIMQIFKKARDGSHLVNTNEKIGPFYFRCKQITVQPYAGNNSVLGVDGENGPQAPFVIRCVPKAIPLIFYSEECEYEHKPPNEILL